MEKIWKSAMTSVYIKGVSVNESNSVVASEWKFRESRIE